MRRYLVGGAVRDALLGLPVGERDWVVTGTTPEAMVAAGYRPVGKDFPVFLDPETHEETALARTERKSGRGYHGFTFHTGPEVTIEEDLVRRDLTVNAIAQDEQGALIDPHGGRRDLDARVLRHVSDAFAEDPVRILRTARFAARFAPLGFRIADATLDLMRRMVEAGEADALVAERVWKECERALMLDRPSAFFSTLRDCGALARVMPEVDALFGVPQPAKHHPEIDTGVHTLLVLDQAARTQTSLAVRVACLCHDFGKALTPAHALPSHRGHEAAGVAPVEAFCARLRVPKDYRELALHVCKEHLLVHTALELRPETLLNLFERLDALRRRPRFEDFLRACECDARGRTGLEDRDYPQPDYLRAALESIAAVKPDAVVADGFRDAALGEELRRRRLAALAAWKRARG